MIAIEVVKIAPSGTLFSGKASREILGLNLDASIRVDEDILYDIMAVVASRELILQGSLSLNLSLQCSRCAEFFSTSVGDSSFLRVYPLASDKDTVDMTDDIREGILLSIPSFPRCAYDCRGLCPTCGKNLNYGKCGCRSEKEDLRWSALDRITL